MNGTMPAADEAVVRALALVGTPFRPQGRDARGLDCIGLAAAALQVSPGRAGYRLRGGSAAALEAGLGAAGMTPAAEMAPGVLLVMRAGPEQLHLGIWTGATLIHADAGLRRVVERPGPPPWPVLSLWRKET